MGLSYFSQFSHTKLKRTLNFMYLFAGSPQSGQTMGSWSGHHSRIIGNLKKKQKNPNKPENILRFSFLSFSNDQNPTQTWWLQEFIYGPKLGFRGQSHRKSNSSASEDGLLPEVYLHHLSQHNIESFLLTPGRINFKTCKNSELIHLLMPAWAAAEFFLDLDQR